MGPLGETYTITCILYNAIVKFYQFCNDGFTVDFVFKSALVTFAFTLFLVFSSVHSERLINVNYCRSLHRIPSALTRFPEQ